MIDEELYQRATDELNSDRRRPHLWARACALSSDDHDEARYLYTNLRVEELIAERDRAAGSPDAGAASNAPSLDALALEPLDGDAAPGADDAPGDAGDAGGAFGAGLDARFEGATASAADDGPVPGSLPTEAPPGASGDAAEDRTGAGDDLDGALDDTEPETPFAEAGPPRSVRPGHGASGHAPDLDAGLDAGPDPEPIRPASARDPMQLDLDTSAVELDAEEIARAERAHETLEEASRAAPTEPAREGGVPAPPRRDAHAGGRPHAGLGAGPERPDDAPSRAAAPLGPVGGPARSPEPRIRLHDVDDQLDEVLDGGGGASAAARRAFGPRTRDYADRGDLDTLLEERRRDAATDVDEPLEVIEDDEGPGRRWSVLEAEDGELRAVKRGVCWPALVATLPWLLARGLLGTAIVYALLWAVSLGGAAMTGLAWLDAGPAVSDGTVFAFAGFALIAFAGLVLAPFLRANRWRTRKLVRRGWEIAGELRARSAADALGRFRELDVGRR